MAVKFKIIETKIVVSLLRAINVFENCIGDSAFSFKNLKDLGV